jgi:radical SAM protein with 4Fe4S-binding SPASM domain
MVESFISDQCLEDFSLWEKKKQKGALFSFTLETTARCNNRCRHCYINLPETDSSARADELSLAQLKDIADQAVDLGAVWCLITGGEPLLRDDFEELYFYLKKKGLLVSVFTNATLISESHVRLFQKYPPRDLEVTVYGMTQKIYGRVTRRPDLFNAFRAGLSRLLEAGVKVNLKAVPIKANIDEYKEIADFCRKYSHGPFRFDPLIHLRFDRDEKKNEQIRPQRLSPEQIASLERRDEKRFVALQRNCNRLILPETGRQVQPFLFTCGAGLSDFVVSYNGFFRLCSSLWHPECIYDLKNGSVKEARQILVPKVRSMTSYDPGFLNSCAKCRLVNLCLWCPANAWLETGRMDLGSQYFCRVAKARAQEVF